MDDHSQLDLIVEPTDWLAVPPLDHEVDFADRLNSLLEADFGPSSNPELAAALRAYEGLGLDRTTATRISRYRSGQRSHPRIGLIPGLCLVYDVPPSFFFSAVVAAEVFEARNPTSSL